MAFQNALKFLALDVQSHKDALLARVQSRWPTQWNDFTDNSLAMMIVDIIAWSGALIAYTVNKLAGENFVATMSLRESAVRLASLTGYKMKSAQPATVATEAALSVPTTERVTIIGIGSDTGLAPQQVRVGGLVFEVAKDYVIEAGSTSPKVTVATIAPTLVTSTQNDIQTSILVYNGYGYCDLIDSSIDLTRYIEPGMIFQAYLNGIAVDSPHTITGVTYSQSGYSNNRIVFGDVWSLADGTVTGIVYDTRVQISEGQTVTDTFSTPSAGTQSFSVRLTQTQVIDGSATVEFDGTLWTEVSALALASPTDAVYEVVDLSNGQTGVRFGDGVFGAAVPAGASLTIQYRIGGGTAGNVATGTVGTSVTGTTDSGAPVTVYLTNVHSAGIGGADAESVNEARVNIPAHTQMNDRGVTLSDYQQLALEFRSPVFGRVNFARASTQIRNNLLEGNIVLLYAWTATAGGRLVPISNDFKAALRAYVQNKGIGTDYVVVDDGQVTPLPVSIRYKVKSNYSLAATQPLLIAAVEAYTDTLSPGDPLIYSDFMSRISAVAGIDYLVPATPVANLYTETDNEIFTYPDSGTLRNIPLTYIQGNIRSGVIPVSPLAAWGIEVVVGADNTGAGGTTQSVIPDVEPGYARIVGPDILGYREGPLTALGDPESHPSAYFSVNTGVTRGTLYKSTLSGTAHIWTVVTRLSDLATKSRIDLRTGEITVCTASVGANVGFRLVAVDGFDRERSVNVYLGITTDVADAISASLRRDIRSAIRSCMDQLEIGSGLFSSYADGIQSSAFNIMDIVANVPGVTAVNRVSLDTPGSTLQRIDAEATELLRPGMVVINNELS